MLSQSALPGSIESGDSRQDFWEVGSSGAGPGEVKVISPSQVCALQSTLPQEPHRGSGGATMEARNLALSFLAAKAKRQTHRLGLRTWSSPRALEAETGLRASEQAVKHPPLLSTRVLYELWGLKPRYLNHQIASPISHPTFYSEIISKLSKVARRVLRALGSSSPRCIKS